MSQLPYYISWSKQRDAAQFEIQSVEGVKIKTTSGMELIDLSSISYQAHFGHNHPVIIKHIKDQLDTIPMSSPKGIYPHKLEATQALLNYMQMSDGKIFYTTSGAESVENALKMARDITQKKIVLARQNSYHGATLGALTVTGDWRNPLHQTPQDWVVRIPEPNEENALKKTRDIILKNPNNIAAIIIETITGGNGVYAGDINWWSGLRALCDEFSIMLIMDEVVCGFHRTGKAFGYMHYGVSPDFVCLAKGITGGMIPFGAVWTSPKIASFYEDHMLSCGLTNYAHPLGVAAMRGVLEILNDSLFQNHLRQIESIFAQQLELLKQLSIVKEIRYHGMLAAIDLHHNIDAKNFMQAGLYLVAQSQRLILAPPLIIQEDLLLLAMKKLTSVLKENT
ncbi:MAG: aminotransferase class III-fold pyridoxal phosphate-dependent enzyme [Bacteriovorax sp.]|nr:aminotransferase class III-fold pyridoxal phosphate-dependent enzyme [Bacteriovorax sp.]